MLRFAERYISIIKNRLRFLFNLRLYYIPSYPVEVTWAITGRCNSRCVYCESWDQIEAGSDLPLNRVIELINEMDSIGIKSVFLAGGEPFCRNDIWTILEHLHKRKINVSLCTNALFIPSFGKEELSILRKAVSMIYISLDSLQNERQDYLRGVPRSYNKVINSLKILKNNGINNLRLNVVISKLNFVEIPDILLFAKLHGVNHVCFQPISPITIFSNTWPKTKKNELLINEEDDMRHLMEKINEGLEICRSKKISSDLFIFGITAIPYFQSLKRGSNNGKFYLQNIIPGFKCIRVAWDVFIDYDGSLKPCAVLAPFGSIVSNSLKEESKKRLKIFNTIKSGRFPAQCKYCFCNARESVIFSAICSPIRNKRILSQIRAFGH